LLTGWLDAGENADQERLVARLTQELASLGLVSAQPALVDLLSLPEPKQPIGAGLPGSAGETASSLARLNNELERRETTGAARPPARLSGLQALLQQRVDQTEHTGESMWQRLQERVDSTRVVGKLVKKLVERQPLLVIVEDIHWADANSLALLNELAAEAPGLALMVVATGHEPADEEAVFTPLPLAALPEAAITEVAQRALHARRLDPPLAEWIARQAGGNPLFAEELCQALLRSDAVLLDRSTGEVRWTQYVPELPLSLHQLLLARFDKLPQAGQDILIRAAVFGQSFEYDGLLKLCHGYLGETQVQAALEGAIESSFLTIPQETVYRFHHPLMQEAIYATLSFSQRQNWHSHIGDWLVERQQGPDEALELIAYHYLRGKNTTKAAHFGCRAGDRARERGMYAGALEFYQQVLALADGPEAERVRATEGQGDVLALQGDHEAARRAYTLAAELGSPTALGKRASLSGELET
jgi:predicted ATPase